MIHNAKKKTPVIGGKKRMLLSMLLSMTFCGCITPQPKLNNSERLMSHPEFKAAVIAAPNFTRETLQTINALEREIEAPD